MFRFKPIFLYQADPPPTPPADPPPPAPADPPPGPVPYDRFREVNEQLKETQKKLTRIEAAQRTADDKLAADKGEWEKLARQHEAELKAERTARLRLEVAGKKGIPVDLVDRLKGDTVEEMEADADSLLAFLKPKESKGIPPAGKSSTPPATDFSKMTPAEIRKAVKGKPLNELA